MSDPKEREDLPGLASADTEGAASQPLGGQDLRSLIGATLCESYVLEEILGQGGMGTVFRARHVRLPTRFAVKLLRPEARANPEIFARFRREAEVTSALHHPGIVQVVDWNSLPDGTPFLVMEYLEGEDLQHRLDRVRTLSLDEALRLARQVGSALSAAHRLGVVHRDLKPSNIFLSRHEEAGEWAETAKVVDFGISKIRSSHNLTTGEDRLLGTPQFMAPEQIRSPGEEVDHRTDQYALGLILYQALSGVQPFSAETQVASLYRVLEHTPQPLRQVAPHVPPHVEAAICRAMSRRRDDRFPHMVAFLHALSSAKAASPRHPARRNIGLLAGVLLGLLAGGLILGLALRRERVAERPVPAPTPPAAPSEAAARTQAPAEVAAPPAPLPAPVDEEPAPGPPPKKAEKRLRRREASPAQPAPGRPAEPPTREPGEVFSPKIDPRF